MSLRIWMIRLSLSFIISILSLFISLFKGDSILLHYVNTTFMIGLLFLMISGITLIVFSGFFNVFVIGWKKLFFKEDPASDKSHWSYEQENQAESTDDIRKKAKLELFLYLPLFIALFLILQSVLLMYLLD